MNIKIENTAVYMDYQLYTISVKNETEDTILLDTRKKTDTVYTINSNGAKIEALLHENKEKDLKVEAGEEKKTYYKI